MQTLHFEIHFNATASQVWHGLFDTENYKLWTHIFHEGSYYKTQSFSKGSKIHFLIPTGDGMFSVIDEIEINRLMIFRHLGTVKNFEEQPIDDSAQSWCNSLERYYLTEQGNQTKLEVVLDAVEEFIPYFNNTFPVALQKLKDLVESSNL